MNCIDRVRDGCIAKGLVERTEDGAYVLTPAGNDHVEKLVEELKRAPPPDKEPAIRWVYGRNPR